MKAFPANMLCLLVFLAGAPAHAQSDRLSADSATADAIGPSLQELLALTTLGTLATQNQAARVTRNNADYLVRIPLEGFSAPSDAAVNAVARPLSGGVWDVASMTLPSLGTFQPSRSNANIGPISYSIAEQTIQGQIDPAFQHPSSFIASFGGIKFRNDNNELHVEQAFDRYSMDGSFSAETAGQLDFASNSKATNWHMTAHSPRGLDSEANVRLVSSRFLVEGVNRSQATRLLTAAQALKAESPMPVAGQPPTISIAQRQKLRDLTDALPGLLRTLQTEETFDDIRFAAGPAKGGTINRVHISMEGGSADSRLSAQLGIVVDGLMLSGVPADTAAYLPHHLEVKSNLAGIGIEQMMALLRAATAPDVDFAMLQPQIIGLLADPDARIGIETIAFDSGPLRVTGSARFHSGSNGQPVADIHLAASGMDALITQAQGTPALQQALPVMFIAKGMGHAQGDSTTWDIVLGNGPPTVNGMRFGQPTSQRR